MFKFSLHQFVIVLCIQGLFSILQAQSNAKANVYIHPNEVCAEPLLTSLKENYNTVGSGFVGKYEVIIQKRSAQSSYKETIDIIISEPKMGTRRGIYTTERNETVAQKCAGIANEAHRILRLLTGQSVAWQSRMNDVARENTTQVRQNVNTNATNNTANNTANSTQNSRWQPRLGTTAQNPIENGNTATGNSATVQIARQTDQLNAASSITRVDPTQPVTDTRKKIFFDCVTTPIGLNGNQTAANECLVLREIFVLLQADLISAEYTNIRNDADIVVLVTPDFLDQNVRYEIKVLGQKEFLGRNQNIFVNTQQNDTRIQKKDVILFNLSQILLPYSINIAPRLNTNTNGGFANNNPANPTQAKTNPWLIFSNVNGNFNVSETSKSINILNATNVNKTIAGNRLDMGIQLGYTSNSFTFGEGDQARTTQNSYLDWNVSLLRAKFINSHWSVGGMMGSVRAVSQNIKGGFLFMPGVEYSIFPVRDTNTRQLNVRYLIGTYSMAYVDTTYLGITRESLLANELAVQGNFYEKWGFASMTIKTGNFFTKVKDRSLNFNGNVSFRLSQMLSINTSVFGFLQSSIKRYSNNFFANNITAEDILLGRAKQPSNFSLGGSIGFTLNFGSNFVNPSNQRFGQNQITL